MKSMGHRTKVSLAALVVAGMAAAGCATGTATDPAALNDAIAIETAPVRMTDVADTFEAGGVVAARTTATLMARIVAPVAEVRVSPGDRVRAGQVLVVLDSRDLSAGARRARATGLAADHDAVVAGADRQAAAATLELARSTHARIAGLHANRSATAQELDEATAALRGAEARAASADAREKSAAAALEGAHAASDAAQTIETYARIAAPFDGVVTEKLIETGNMAAPGTPLLRVEDERGFRLDVRVDASRVGHVTPGLVVPTAVDTGAADAPLTIDGSVTEVSRAVDADTRAFLVKIALPAAGGVRSGMFGRATFRGRSRRVLAVPAAALVRRGQITSVFVVDHDVARMRLVDVSGTEVLAGLSQGEIVIVAPPQSIVDGRKVRAGGQ